MTGSEYLRRVEDILGKAGRGMVLLGGERPWGIQWLLCPVDPFTNEQPVSAYYTPAEAFAAAGSLYDPYLPSDYPQTTEPVEVESDRE